MRERGVSTVTVTTRWDVSGLGTATRSALAVSLPAGVGGGLSAFLEEDRVELIVGPVALDRRGVGAHAQAGERLRAALMTRFPAELSGRQTTELRFEPAADDLARDVALLAAPALLALTADPSLGPALGVDEGGLTIVLGIGSEPRLFEDVVVYLSALIAAIARKRSAAGSVRSLLRHHVLVAIGADGSIRLPARTRGGAPTLARGRLTPVRARSASGRTTRVTVQQSLTALGLYARDDVARLVGPARTSEIVAAMEGAAPLPIDRLAGEIAPQRIERARTFARRQTAKPPTIAMLALGAPPAPVRRELGLPASGPNSPETDDAFAWRGLLRAGRAMYAHGRADVVVCPWYQVAFVEDDRVALNGTLLGIGEHGARPMPATMPVFADAMFFYPIRGRGAPGGSTAEAAAIEHLDALGLVRRSWARHRIGAEILREAARRGLPTNVTSAESMWWRKDVLELGLRAYTRATGRSVARPPTFVVAGGQVPLAVEHFHAAGAGCLVKPVGGSGADGIEIVSAGGPRARHYPHGDFVVQRLVDDPVLVGGRKIDLRSYVLVDTLSRERSRWLRTVFARRAIARFSPAAERAELTNTSYRLRSGLVPSIVPLGALKGMPAQMRREIEAGIAAVVTELLDALFWWTDTAPERGARRPATRRILLWGLDFLASRRDGALDVQLLEINAYPLLYRGSPACDREVDALIRDAVAPELLRTHVARRPRRRLAAAPIAHGPVVTLLTTRTRHSTARALVARWQAMGAEVRVGHEVLGGTGAALHWGLDGRNAHLALRRAALASRQHGTVLVNRVLIDKWSQLQRLRAAAIPAPESALVATLAEALVAADRIGYPVVLKPLWGSYSSGVVCVADAAQLRSAWRPRHRVVQERLRDGGRCARVLVVGDEVVHAVTRVARDGFHATYAHGRMAWLEPFAGDAGDLGAAVAATRALGLQIGGVDVVCTSSGPRILEVNHRGVEFGDRALHGPDAIDRVASYVVEASRGHRVATLAAAAG